jgi:hypothetical protein
MNPNKTPKKRGRKPLTFTKKQLEKAKKLSSLGFSEESIARAVFGISVSTLQRRKKTDAKFEQYIREGKIEAIENVSNALYESAVYDKSVPAQIFFLKNKGKQAGNPFADIQQVESSISLQDIMANAKGRLIEGEQVQERIPVAQVLVKDSDNQDNDNK